MSAAAAAPNTNDTAANVVVAVRTKPIDPSELAQGHKMCIVPGSSPGSCRIVGPYQDERSFAFDFCFWSGGATGKKNATQSDIYDALGKRLLKHAWEGFNCSGWCWPQRKQLASW